MTQPDSDPRIGTVLKGKWTLERVLGTGGMATVYVGKHTIQRRDAIKILHPEFARQKEIRARFELEGHATNRFRHKGAVEIQDCDVSEDGCPFLVMELLDGESLGDRARRLGDIPLDELLRCVAEVLDVLDAAHREGVVHRDIKPENIFVMSDGRVRVLDFGVARVRESAMQTQLGARLGTTGYMPPEQIRGGEIDGRADLFALGVVMFRLITKQKVHDAPSENELVIKMASDRAPKIRSIRADVPAPVALVVDRALEYHAKDRYPDARTMLDDLTAVRQGRPPPFASSLAAPFEPSVVAAPPPSSAQTRVPRGLPTMTTAPPVSVAQPLPPPSIEAPQRPKNKLMGVAILFSIGLSVLGIVVLLATRNCGDGADQPEAASSAKASATVSSGMGAAPTPPPSTKSTSDAADLMRRVQDLEKSRKR